MKQLTDREFRIAFCARTRAVRAEAGFTQAEMAKVLEIPRDHYKQYEIRSPLPHHLIRRFCAACRVAIDSLFQLDREMQPLRRPPKAAE